MPLHAVPTRSGLTRALAALLLLTGCAPARTRSADGGEPPAGYRIYDARAGDFITLPELGRRLSGADVVLFGEQHDDAVAHQVQRALLETLSESRPRTALGLESFERDVQPRLDAYLAGEIPEEELLASARPWANYSAAHRPLVETAKRRGWPVIASNAPRPLAAMVARGGLDTLRTLDARRRRWVAAELRCPRDEYFERFAAGMEGHGIGAAAVERYYEAQCVKDETMAESIAQRVAADPGLRVVHVQGSFHSDYGQGIVPRIRRRAPAATVRTVSAIPVAHPGAVDVAEHRGRADYLLFTPLVERSEPAGGG